jgi:ABC-type polysaccharide/polyol phosphate export permease
MFEDLHNALKRSGLAFELAKTDLIKSYTRTLLGPFWETISLGILLFLMSFLWSKLIKTEGNYVIYLVTGMIIFRFISQILNSSTWLFIERSDIVKCFNVPHSSLALSKVIYAVFIFFHHFPLIIIFSYIYDNKLINTNLFYLFYSIPIIIITSYSSALIVGMLTARFRDIMSLISTITSVMIFFTPILWSPERLDARTHFFVVDPNIFFHYIEIIRQPLIGNEPSMFSIFITFVFSLLIFMISTFLVKKYEHRIRYWV